MPNRKKNGKKKIFVLDTNVILHNSNCISTFEENDVCIPMTVLEELDTFKKGNDSNAYHARRFASYLRDVCSNHPYNGGFRIGPGKGLFSIILEENLASVIKRNFIFDVPDRRILNAVYCLSKKNPQKEVWLITKDSYMYSKAQAIELNVDDYRRDNVGNVDDLYEGISNIENVPSSILSSLYENSGKVSLDELQLKRSFVPNEFLVLRNNDDLVLTRFYARNSMLYRVMERSAYGIKPRNLEQKSGLDALLDPRISIVSLSGGMGTGKTLLAIAAALECRESYKKILLARPTVPIKDEGFLPGTAQEKSKPFMKPIEDNIEIIIGDHTGKRNEIESMRKKSNRLEIEPLSFIRGRSLLKAYFIIDEAQNLTPSEVKTIVGRAGRGTKIVFVGDIFQIDHPYLTPETNGLAHLIKNLPGQDVYAHVRLIRGERSLLAEIAEQCL